MVRRLTAVLALRGDTSADRLRLRRWFVVFVAWMAALTAVACWGLAIEAYHPTAGRIVWLLSLYAFYLSLANTYCPLPTSWIVMLVPSAWMASFVGLGPQTLVARAAVAATVGAVGTAMANLNEYHLTTYLLRLGRIRRVREMRLYQTAVRWFDRAPMAALMVVAFIPIPVDVVRWLAIVRQYPRGPFAAAYLAGRGVRYLLLALLSIGLSLTVWQITLIQAALVAAAATRVLIGVVRRRRRGAEEGGPGSLK